MTQAFEPERKTMTDIAYYQRQIGLAARGERQLLEFESAMDRQLRRVWVSVVSNELFSVETAEMLERRTNSASRRDRGPRTLAGFRHRAVFSSSG